MPLRHVSLPFPFASTDWLAGPKITEESSPNVTAHTGNSLVLRLGSEWFRAALCSLESEADNLGVRN